MWTTYHIQHQPEEETIKKNSDLLFYDMWKDLASSLCHQWQFFKRRLQITLFDRNSMRPNTFYENRARTMYGVQMQQFTSLVNWTDEQLGKLQAGFRKGTLTAISWSRMHVAKVSGDKIKTRRQPICGSTTVKSSRWYDSGGAVEMLLVK